MKKKIKNLTWRTGKKKFHGIFWNFLEFHGIPLFENLLRNALNCSRRSMALFFKLIHDRHYKVSHSRWQNKYKDKPKHRHEVRQHHKIQSGLHGNKRKGHKGETAQDCNVRKDRIVHSARISRVRFALPKERHAVFTFLFLVFIF